MLPDEKQRIENVIMDIMVNDGPDRHTDGSDILADFIESILDGTEDDWQAKYFKTKDRYYTN